MTQPDAARKGFVAELTVLADLAANDYIAALVAQPYVAYDLLAEKHGKLFRVQVKLAYHTPSLALRFHCSRSGEGGAYEPDDFDYLAVVLPERGILYLPWRGKWRDERTQRMVTDEMEITFQKRPQ